MEKSQLKEIIIRLEAMCDEDAPIDVRHFEHDGRVRCEVSYNRENDSFELTPENDEHTYSFDSIDYAAVEIWELIQ